MDRYTLDRRAPLERTLHGRAYSIRPLAEEQVSERYIGWLNDPEVVRYLECRWVSQTRETVRAYVRSFYGETEKYLWGVYALEEESMVGTASLHSISPHHGSAHVGLLVGDRAHWGRGASAEALDLVARFAFDVRGLRRITAGTYAMHHAMNFTCARVGFTLEGKLRQALQLQPGLYVDNLRWGLLADEWRARRSAPSAGPGAG